MSWLFVDAIIERLETHTKREAVKKGRADPVFVYCERFRIALMRFRSASSTRKKPDRGRVTVLRRSPMRLRNEWIRLLARWTRN